MVVLGGFSVLGHCLLEPVKTDDSVEIEKVLSEAHKVIIVHSYYALDGTYL